VSRRRFVVPRGIVPEWEWAQIEASLNDPELREVQVSWALCGSLLRLGGDLAEFIRLPPDVPGAVMVLFYQRREGSQVRLLAFDEAGSNWIARFHGFLDA
jgi:hypothetical protein